MSGAAANTTISLMKGMTNMLMGTSMQVFAGNRAMATAAREILLSTYVL